MRAYYGIAGNCIFACLLAASTIGCVQVARGQGNQKTTTVSSSKYGAGGTVESTSNDKYQIVKEVWKDKDGRVREEHHRTASTDTSPLTDEWLFYRTNGSVAANFRYVSGRDSNFVRRQGIELPAYGVSKAEVDQWIEEIEKQFAEDGEIIDPSHPKKKEVGTKVGPQKPADEKKKENEDTKLEPPKLPADNEGLLDSSLVGTWHSTSMSAANGGGTTSGGAGISMTIKADRTVSLDYSGMEPLVYNDRQGKQVKVVKWGGSAHGHIATKNGAIIVKSADRSDVTWTVDGNPRTTSNLSFGALLTPDPATNSYVCKDNHLTITMSVAGVVLNTFELTRK